MSTTVALGTLQGVFLLSDTGGEWKLVGQGLSGREVTCLLARPGGALLAGTAGNGIFRSADRLEWAPLVNDLAGRGVYSLASHPHQPEVLLCGTAPASLQLSLDGGQSFQELSGLRQHAGAAHWSYPEAPYRSRLHRLYLHPGDANVLVAGILSGGIYVSGDVGQTWYERNRGVGRLVHDLCPHPRLPNRLYAAGPTGVFVSDDFGEHWQEHNAGLAYLHCSALLAHPEDAEVLFLAAHRNAAGGGIVYRSSNGGARWEACEGLPYHTELRYTCLALRGSTLLTATNRGELYVSRDLGSTWGKARSALPPVRCVSLL